MAHSPWWETAPGGAAAAIVDGSERLPMEYNSTGYTVTLSVINTWLQTSLAATFAPTAEGVTNGNSHDHSVGDGGQIDHATLANKGSNTHTQLDSAVSASTAHISATGNPHSATAGDIPITEIGTATWRTIQAFIRIMGSSGIVSGGTITDAGSQTFSVAAGTGMVRSSNGHTAELFSFNWSASNGRSIADTETRYVYVDYNNGSPVVADTTDRSTIDRHTKLEIGIVTREGTALHIINDPDLVANAATHISERFRHQVGNQRASGLILGETGTRNITVTSGEIYSKLNEFDIAAIDTSVAHTFDTYRAGTFVSTGNTQWPNTQYDNGNALADLTANRYSCLWFYVEGDEGDLVMVYGTSNSATVAGAEAEAPPTSISPRLSAGGLLIGRIIFQKSASQATLIETAFATMFSSGQAQSHADLANLAFTDSGHTGFAPEAAATPTTVTNGQSYQVDFASPERTLTFTGAAATLTVTGVTAARKRAAFLAILSGGGLTVTFDGWGAATDSKYSLSGLADGTYTVFLEATATDGSTGNFVVGQYA